MLFVVETLTENQSGFVVGMERLGVDETRLLHSLVLW